MLGTAAHLQRDGGNDGQKRQQSHLVLVQVAQQLAGQGVNHHSTSSGGVGCSLDFTE